MEKFNYIQGVKAFGRKGSWTISRVITLALGLATALVLVAKISYDRSYDRFFPDGERIYQICTQKLKDEPNRSKKIEEHIWRGVSGGVAPGVMRELPEVEVATRFHPCYGEQRIQLIGSKEKIEASGIFVDEHFFDVFGLPILQGGSPFELLSQPNTCLISDKLAERIQNPLKKQCVNFMDKENPLTIVGVFKSLPKNSHLDFDYVVSMLPTADFKLDGMDAWVRADRFSAYVKLKAQADVAQTEQSINEIRKKYGSKNDKIKYFLMPLYKIHADNSLVNRSIKLYSIIAFALLLTILLNYILMFIATLLSRIKYIGISKCYGASKRDLSHQFTVETIIFFFVSLLIAAFLTYLFRGPIEQIMEVQLPLLYGEAAFFPILILSLVMIIILSFFSTYLSYRVPIGSVFGDTIRTGHRWKLGLLFVQFAASSFMLSLLLYISKQYDRLVNDNPGYRYEHIYFVRIKDLPDRNYERMKEQLLQFPEVVHVGASSNLFYQNITGNEIYVPGNQEKLFNVRDFLYCSPNFFQIMGIPLLEGHYFDEQTSTAQDALVSESLAKKLVEKMNWRDGVIGKEIIVPLHDEVGIGIVRGVYSDIRTGSLSIGDKRTYTPEMLTAPSLIFCSDGKTDFFLNFMVVRLRNDNSELLGKMNNLLQQGTDKTVQFSSYADTMRNMYRKTYTFRLTMSVGSVILLVVSMIGVIGYTTNEVNRRSKELAIRRINGASLQDILNSFIGRAVWISLPAVLVGSICAFFVGTMWSSNFIVKAKISWILYVGVAIIVPSVVSLVTFLSARHLAQQNPVDILRIKSL